MPVYHANMGPIVIRREEGARQFLPEPGTRHVLVQGATVGRNPVKKWMPGTQAARMIIGGNVNNEPTWNALDMEEAFMREWTQVVKDLKEEGVLGEGAGAGASVIAQRGVWQGGHPEISVQIIVINDLGIPQEVFQQEMIGIAERLCVELKQGEIYVDFQLGGISQGIAVVEA